jgi:hypothetical protein
MFKFRTYRIGTIPLHSEEHVKIGSTCNSLFSPAALVWPLKPQEGSCQCWKVCCYWSTVLPLRLCLYKGQYWSPVLPLRLCLHKGQYWSPVPPLRLCLYKGQYWSPVLPLRLCLYKGQFPASGWAVSGDTACISQADLVTLFWGNWECVYFSVT